MSVLRQKRPIKNDCFWVRLARILSHHTALAIEPRGGRVGGGPAMLVRPVGHDHPRPWNKGLLVGQKKPLQPKHVWSIRVRLEIALTRRDLALFNGDRQQASRMRFGQTSVQRSGTSDNRSKKDGPTGAIRDYGADEDLPRNLVADAPDNWLSISLPEPTSCTPSPIHPAILPASASLGR